MNSQNNRRDKYYVCEATSADNAKLLELIENSSSSGMIEMIYTRRPYPYESYMSESKDVKIILFKNQLDEILVKIVIIVRKVFINGKVEKIGYVTGLRKTDKFIRANWIKQMSLYIKEQYKLLDIYFSSVLDGNEDAVGLFEKDRSFMPKKSKIGRYSLYFIKTGLRVKNNEGLHFKNAEESDRDKLIKFINKEGLKFDLFPYVSNIEEDFNDLSIGDFYILEKNNEIVCVGCLWNQQSYKQYLILKYNGTMKIISLWPSLSKLFGYFKLPKAGEYANFATLSLLISKDDNPEYYDYFIRKISKTNKRIYDFIIAFRLDDDKTSNIFTKFKHIRYQSTLYFGYFENSILLDYLINSEKPKYIECGFL